MSLLYKDKKDIIHSVEAKVDERGNVNLLFTCDGGKHGTEEILDEYNMSPQSLLKLLQEHFENQ